MSARVVQYPSGYQNRRLKLTLRPSRPPPCPWPAATVPPTAVFLSSPPSQRAAPTSGTGLPSFYTSAAATHASQPSIPNPTYKPRNSRNRRTRIQIGGPCSPPPHHTACRHVGDRYGRGRGGGAPPGAAAEAREEAALRGGRERTRRRRPGPLRRRLPHPPQIGNADPTSPASPASTEKLWLTSRRWNSGGRHGWLSKNQNQNSMLMEP